MKIKIEFEFDIELITADGLYNIDDFTRCTDVVFERYNLKKLEDGIYEGVRSEPDFAYFGKVILKLKKEDWFMRYVSKWLFHTDSSVEDVLHHYQNKADRI